MDKEKIKIKINANSTISRTRYIKKIFRERKHGKDEEKRWKKIIERKENDERQKKKRAKGK